ncbi:type II toxin-antitoxin system RelE family toxin [Pedobacter insulae]|uniref:mRNA-degrading endonuclease RelE, toxin component of the RelBE toxin-antitoxin system n=1 Tax=Pedobacter insulae TaxID=414048 RepID=A0A1I2THL8_9SPHI|nr:hypothetical protein [Pedobacter insulae]SFG61831.1 mRNA-degrading endonuclease RelE, toxin component of the RelBE toxin-antitoxin system [Pedobacter insulae]
MNYKIKVLPNFIREVKKIAKKHSGFKRDLSALISELETNPTLGTPLGQNFYKIRLSISGTNKGKSGGVRVITYVILEKETVLLSEIYLKSVIDTVNIKILIERLADEGLI